MTQDDNILGLSRVDTTDLEPMVIDGEQHGIVHWIRNDDRNGRVYRAAIWVMPAEQLPYVSPYTFVNEETFAVLEGSLEITWANGSVTVVRAGDVVSVAAGTTSNWRIDEPFRKLVIEVAR